MSWPISVTSPVEGASSPPSRCSSVLLPEPDAPTTASVSPARTCRSTSCSTCTSRPPSEKRRPRPAACSTTAPGCTFSLIAQGLRGTHAAGAPARVDGGEEGEQQRPEGDLRHFRQVRVAGHAVDQVDAGGQEAGVQQV